MTTEETANQITGNSPDPLLGRIIELIIDKFEPEKVTDPPLSYSDKAKIIKDFLASEIIAEKKKLLEELRDKFQEKDLLGSYNLIISEINELEEGKEKGKV